MAVRSESDFSLGQQMNRENSVNSLGANETVRERSFGIFRESLLCIDDTVLNALDIEKREYIEEERRLPVINDLDFDSFNYHDNSGVLINDDKSDEHNYSKFKEYAHLDYDDFHNNSTPEDRETAKNNQTLNERDSGINKSEWEDDSLLDRVFNTMDSSEYKELEQTERKRSPLAEVDPNTAGTSKNVETLSQTKRKSLSPLKENRPAKKSRVLETRNPQIDSFYGLPRSVKELIQRVKGIDELYEWQDECLHLKAIRDRKNLIYALPTSGGKTLVAEILMLKEIVANRKNAIFVLPFVAIVQEKVRSLAPFALGLNFLVEEYAAGNGQYPPRRRQRKRTIYVCTIEKGLGLVNSLIENNRLHEVGIVVVDELHLLGEDGGRGATLEGLLTKVMYSNAHPHIIGMSATIGNLEDIAQFLRADVYTKDFRPVELKEYVKCLDNIWLVDLKEEEILTDLKKINYAYSDAATKLDPDRLGGLVMDVIPHDSCLIFCPSRNNCENVAMLLTKVLFKSLLEHKKKEKEILIRSLKAEGALCEILEKTITFGVAYHHSGLMSEERRLLEEAFRSGTLSVLCCTSTLAAGVNLPARRVILRHPYVGNQFLNLSRYKQMIGRAGRAGMKDVGESILICRENEIDKVKELLTSKMDDCISTLHTEEDRGINNLVLSCILLDIASTRKDLHKMIENSLLGIQQEKLNVSTKKIVDVSITRLMKAGAIKVKEVTSHSEVNPNLSVVMPSQNPNSTKTPDKRRRSDGKKIVQLGSKTKLEVCKLGRATMKGCVDLNRAHQLYRDLKCAQSQLVLLDCLHLLYLVTPYDIADQVKPSGNIYCDVVCSLSRVQMETARVLGINETVVTKLRSGVMPKNVEARVVNRFYLTLMLNELWNQQSVHVVSTKYQVNRGIVQNLMNASAAFASGVERFCAELDEFWAFRDLIHSFCKRLSHCCAAELEPLMELPGVKIGRARQLFNAGYKTLQATAVADPKEMCEKIENMPHRIANQIVAASKLLLLEKVENLRDEALEVVEGTDISSF